MRLGRQPVQSIRLWAVIVLVVGWFSATQPAEAAGDTVDAQLAFGIEMAKRGLWNEAIFRFDRVLKERPGDIRVLNNMAVAYEAIGQFDQALDHYKRALAGDSSNRELRRNYAQFVEFYESLRPKTDDEAESADSDDGESTEPKDGSAGEDALETSDSN